MTKIGRQKVQPEKFGEYVNNLWSAFTLLESKQQIRLLFKDLLSHTEYTMLTKRLEIARRLLVNQTYEIIKTELKVTDNTISRMNNILSMGGQGLRLAHQKLSVMELKTLRKQKKYLSHLNNPWLKKIQRKTLLGTALKASSIAADKFISKKLKQHSAIKKLEQ
jgi:uncharacterized protein YerC